MGVSLSKDSQLLLKAASLGDADHISTCVASEPRLIKCTTLLKRSSALHIAASNGHVGVLRALVQPLLQQTRQEVRGGERSGPAAKRLRKVVNARDVYCELRAVTAALDVHMAVGVEACMGYATMRPTTVQCRHCSKFQKPSAGCDAMRSRAACHNLDVLVWMCSRLRGGGSSGLTFCWRILLLQTAHHL